MKHTILFFLLFAFFCASGFSQDTAQTPKQPPQYGWKNSLVSALTLTQVSFTDWAQGGGNALSYTITGDGKVVDDEIETNWLTTYKLAFGQARLSGQGIRKTDDIIDLSSLFTYKIGTYINPYASATLKTQFAKGYMYNANDTAVEVSKFFDPAFLTQSVGFGYQPIKEIKTRLGVGLREIITQDFHQYTDNPATPQVERTKVDGGLESVTNIDWHLDENLLFTSQLELFSPFKTMDQIVVRASAMFTAKVSKYITSIAGLQLINERQISPRTQIEETIALGLSYSIF
jgi:hypothetical protein